RAGAGPEPRREDVRLPGPQAGREARIAGAGRLPEGQGDREVQAARARDGGRRFPGLDVRQGFQEGTLRIGGARVIQLVVPYVAGGGSDQRARLAARYM